MKETKGGHEEKESPGAGSELRRITESYVRRKRFHELSNEEGD
jgi:hypothetical protein